MNGKRDRMKLVCRQCQILIHINDLGVSMKRDPRDVILPFFQRIEEKEYLKAFLVAVDDFIKKIKNRAVEKRKEMDAEREEEESEGLDPAIQAVLDALPVSLREAFESQSVEAFHQRPLAACIYRHSPEGVFARRRLSQFLGKCQKVTRFVRLE